MARIRSTFPGQWTDEDFVECSALARLLVLALRNEADDQGVFEWKPVGLKMRLMPADNIDMSALLSELEERRQIVRFTVHGKVYGAIRNFVRYQKPKKPTKVHPLPPELHEWVRMDLWGGAKKRSGSEPDTDQRDDGSEPDDDDVGVCSELAARERGASSERKRHQRGSSSEPDTDQRPSVPKSSETAALREEGGGKREERSEIGTAAAFTRERTPTREGPPPPDDPGSGDFGAGTVAAVQAVKSAVSKAFEDIFDLPDRPFGPRDEELFAAWIGDGFDRGLTPDRTAEAVAEEVSRQFRRLAERKPDDPPRSLAAVLDHDVRRAVAQAAATRSARPSVPPAVVPPPWSERFDPTTYQRWIAPIANGIVISSGSARIVAPNVMHRDWLVGRLEADIRHCLGVDEVVVVVSDKRAA